MPYCCAELPDLKKNNNNFHLQQRVHALYFISQLNFDLNVKPAIKTKLFIEKLAFNYMFALIFYKRRQEKQWNKKCWSRFRGTAETPLQTWSRGVLLHKIQCLIKTQQTFYHLTWQKNKGDLKAPAESMVFAGGGPESPALPATAEQLGMKMAETGTRMCRWSTDLWLLEESCQKVRTISNLFIKIKLKRSWLLLKVNCYYSGWDSIIHFYTDACLPPH